MGIKLKGMKELKTALNNGAQINNKLRSVVKMNGAELQQKAQRNAPVGTPESTGIPGYVGGTLRRSIDLEIKDSGLTAEVTAKADYSAYVEYGTRFMNAQPYMRPALNEQEKKFVRDVEKAVKI